MNRDDEEFEQRARAALNASMASLDADTRRRLAAGRARALEHKSLFARWLPENNWVPVTTLAAGAVLAVTLFITQRQPDTPMQLAKSDPDIALDILLGDDDGQDAASDPDFYIVMDIMISDEESNHAG